MFIKIYIEKYCIHITHTNTHSLTYTSMDSDMNDDDWVFDWKYNRKIDWLETLK